MCFTRASARVGRKNIMSYLASSQLEYVAQAETATIAVARWWLEVLSCPKQDNGVSGPEADLLSVLSAGLENQISEDFVKVLAKKIQDSNVNWIDVDYHPCRLLAEAVEESGSMATKWPWKSHTRATADGTVVAKYGYGQPEEVIWQPPAS